MENTNKNDGNPSIDGVDNKNTKQDVIKMFKKNIKFYAIPSSMGRRTKLELVKHYNEAVKLGLTIPMGAK